MSRLIQRLVDTGAVVGTALLLGATLLSDSRQDPATASAPRVIEVTAQRFEFQPSQIEVTEGEPVRLLIKSADGVHGFAIKKLKLDKLIPKGGKPVTIDFTAPGAGSFEIMCTEECGEGHADMKATLVVRAKPKTASPKNRR